MIKNIQQKDLFPTSVLFFVREKNLTDEEISFIQNADLEDNSSNYIGTSYDILEKKNMSDIKDFCQACVNEYYNEFYGYNSELIISASWVNKTEPHQSHHMHYHKNSVLSGVFYLEDTNDCPITFYNRKDYFYFADENPRFFNEYNSQSWLLSVPEGNSCIIFPSQLDHAVPKNNSNKDRYSIAFNTFFKKDQRIATKATKLDI